MSKPKLDGEARVAQYLESFGLRIEQYSKAERRASRTPDFKVYGRETLAFYCEVKTAQEDTWLDDLLENTEPGTIVGGLRNDSTYNRIALYVHESVGQFDAVNASMALPNVLAIVNGDSDAGTEDLLHVFSGNLEWDFATVISMFPEFSEGRIKDSKWKIHLVIWFNNWSQDAPHFFVPGTITSPQVQQMLGLLPR